MSNSNSGDWVLPAAIIVIGFVVFAIWKFSQAVGLDFSTGAEVLKWLVPIVAVWIALWYLTPFSFWDTWPLALASLWSSWWPALDYWSNHSAAGGLLQYGIGESMWYAKWYTKWGVLIGIVAVGYGVAMRLRK